MKVLFYSVKKFEIPFINKANKNGLKIKLLTKKLNIKTAVLSKNYEAICIFTNDDASLPVLNKLFDCGVKFIATRATGYDNIDVENAIKIGISICNVPEYSPHSIAEHTILLMLSLLKKSKIVASQVKEYNFTTDEIIGENIHNKTVGIIGTGRIGSITAEILKGFGANVIAYDIEKNEKLKKTLNIKYVSLETLCKNADIITIHIPLNTQTHYLINKERIDLMKENVVIINTARGQIIDTKSLLKKLKIHENARFGMDVYEKENGVFFFKLSKKKVADPVLDKLILMDNVIVTPHQAFATVDALKCISEITMSNLNDWYQKDKLKNEVLL
jgi:D-lactate dehydrogenase